MTKSFRRFSKTLLSSTYCGYTIRCHNPGSYAETEDVCSNFITFSSAFVVAENFLKVSITENILRAKPPLKDPSSVLKSFTVSYPESCLKRGACSGGNRLFIGSQRMKSMLQTKSTKDLGCKFENVWEFQRLFL